MPHPQDVQPYFILPIDSSLDMDKLRELQSMREQMKGILAKGICKGICKDEVYELVNEIYQEYGGE